MHSTTREVRMSHAARLVRRGSILMEFVLVLPIYIAFLGMVFAVGEMGLKAMCLAAGDRLGAFARGSDDTDDARSFLRTKLFAMNASNLLSYGDDIKTSAYSDDVDFAELATYLKDSSFKGAWAWLVAATAEDNYALPPWARGWLQYSVQHFASSTDGQSSAADGAMGDLLTSHSLGRVVMRSKDIYDDTFNPRERKYNYYVLTRTEAGRNGYRLDSIWDAGNLARMESMFGGWVWQNYVAEEPYVYDDSGAAASLDNKGSKDSSVDSPEKQDKRGEYGRYDQFLLWSQ